VIYLAFAVVEDFGDLLGEDMVEGISEDFKED
jgi:hypothetical protein